MKVSSGSSFQVKSNGKSNGKSNKRSRRIKLKNNQKICTSCNRDPGQGISLSETWKLCPCGAFLHKRNYNVTTHTKPKEKEGLRKRFNLSDSIPIFT